MGGVKTLKGMMDIGQGNGLMYSTVKARGCERVAADRYLGH